MSYASFNTRYVEDTAPYRKLETFAIDIKNIKSGVDIIKTVRAKLNAIPKNQLGLDKLPQIFEGNMDNLELINKSITSGVEFKDISQEATYNRIIIKNIITNFLLVSDVKIQGSIFYCEFDNTVLSGKYTVKLNLVGDKNYNDEYKSIVYNAIPESKRFLVENINTGGNVDVELNSIFIGPTKNITPSFIIFYNCKFKQMNIINDKKIPLIFINCVGPVNITFNDASIKNLVSKACPACPVPPKQICPACPTLPKQTCPTCPTCPKQTCPTCPKLTCPTCPRLPKQICPSCPKQTCPKQTCPKHKCPKHKCPKHKCPVCEDDDDDDDDY